MNISISTPEIWRDLPEDMLMSKYLISNYGRIIHKRTRNILDCHINLAGYVVTTLALDNGGKKGVLVHILVAIAFLLNPDDKPSVDHINKNRSDNHVDNLRWFTWSEQRTNQVRPKNVGKQVELLTKDGLLIKIWPTGAEAVRVLGFKSDHIAECCLGKRKTFMGFKWKHHKEDIPDLEWYKVPLDDIYEDIYVSKDGLFKRRDKIWKGSITAYGYLKITVRILNTDKYKDFKAHRLIASTFIPNDDPNKIHVNHKNGDKLDNRLENLEWVTPRENVQHAHDTGLHKKNKSKNDSPLEI